MACLDHTCLKPECKEIWFDNDTGSACPACGGTEKVTFFDEPVEDYRDSDDDYDFDGEDW